MRAHFPTEDRAAARRLETRLIRLRTLWESTRKAGQQGPLTSMSYSIRRRSSTSSLLIALALLPCAAWSGEGDLRADVTSPIPAPGELRATGVRGDHVFTNLPFVKEADFATRVLYNDRPVLVFCEAKWSVPAREMTPVIDEIAARYATRLQIVKLDVEENPGLTTTYVISGIPTILLFQQGSVVGTKVGKLSRDQLALWLDERLP